MGAGLRSAAKGHSKLAIWVVLALVLATALAVGASRPGAATVAQRAASIDEGLRCPSCEDLSVAASTAPAAVAIRQIVETRVSEGQSTAQIENFLEARYGVSILLSPPASGLSAAVWVAPLVAVGTALAVLGVLFWRRRRVEPAVVSTEDRLLVEMAMSRASEARRPCQDGEGVVAPARVDEVGDLN